MFSLPAGNKQEVVGGAATINNRDYETTDEDSRYRIPDDARIGDVAFDGTLSPKTMSSAQIHGSSARTPVAARSSSFGRANPGTQVAAERLLSNAKENVMPTMNFGDFMVGREKAAEAYVRGDGARVDTMVPHSGAATFHSPTGDTVVGGEAVARRYLKGAAGFHDNGTSRFDVLQKAESGDIGFWTGFQIAKVQIGDMPKPVEMRIRVTEVLHRVNGDWKMIHRHADAPPR